MAYWAPHFVLANEHEHVRVDGSSANCALYRRVVIVFSEVRFGLWHTFSQAANQTCWLVGRVPPFPILRPLKGLNLRCVPSPHAAGAIFAVSFTPSASITAKVVFSVGLPLSLKER